MMHTAGGIWSWGRRRGVAAELAQCLLPTYPSAPTAASQVQPTAQQPSPKPVLACAGVRPTCGTPPSTAMVAGTAPCARTTPSTCFAVSRF